MPKTNVCIYCADPRLGYSGRATKAERAAMCERHGDNHDRYERVMRPLAAERELLVRVSSRWGEVEELVAEEDQADG